MKKLSKPTTRYTSYLVGFLLSIFATLLVFYIVINHLWPKETLFYLILVIATVQLGVQSVFFLHIGRGNRWQSITYWFTLLVVAIIVIGTIWVMNNLNYNMMHMTPDQMQLYMKEN